jgi:predicted dienelactone hydrolase
MVSPGSNTDDWAYLYIGTRLASHGYVVAVTDHKGNGQWPWSPNEAQVVAMSHFPRDISFAITELLLKNDTAGESLNGIIDPSRIALAGHSLGGYTTYALAGGDNEICDTLAPASYGWESLPYPQSVCGPQPRDSRIRAIVAIDGVSQQLRYSELARISIPSLILGETIEHVDSYNPGNVPTEPNFALWNARPHAAIHRSDSYRVDVTIANHASFANLCDGLKVMSSLGVDASADIPWAKEISWPCVALGTFDPANDPTTRQIVTTYMLAFLNTYFERENDSWMLTSSYARQYQPQVEFFDSEACNECPVGKGEYAYRPHPCQCSVAQQDPADYFAPPVTDGGTP